MSKVFTVREYQSFCKSSFPEPGFIQIPDKVFDTLERFILENPTENEDGVGAWELLSLSVKRGKKVISARNYVGTILLKDGTVIEILPKLDNVGDSDARKVFLKMLRTVKNLPYKSFDKSNVMSDKTTLFEVFIRMFLIEVGTLLKKGIKFGYVAREENVGFLKGKLLFNEHIKQNRLHSERVYVSYDEFEANRPENKLIKKTLEYVQNNSHNSRNRKDCRRYLSMMDEIEASTDIHGDFSKYTANRNMAEYEAIMQWCRVFLLNKSFTPFKGKDLAFALLFPMETLFESYVAEQLHKHYSDRSSFRVTAQDHGYYLFDQPKKFALRPDIVVSNEEDGTTVVLDTKWKMLSPRYSNTYGISQADMYQMYVYHKKYQPRKVMLVYPFNEEIQDSSKTLSYQAYDESEVNIEAVFFDLMNVKSSIHWLETRMGFKC